MPSGWGKGKTLAQRIAEKPIIKEKKQTKVPEKKYIEDLSYREHVDPCHWYVPMVNHGASEEAYPVALANNYSITIAVMIVRQGKLLVVQQDNVILPPEVKQQRTIVKQQRTLQPTKAKITCPKCKASTVATGLASRCNKCQADLSAAYMKYIASSTSLPTENTEEKKGTLDGKYALPGGMLQPIESLQQAAIRLTLEDTGLNFTPRRLVGIEHYTSLATHWLRYGFSGDIEGDLLPDNAIWVSLASVIGGDLQLANADSHNLLCAYQEGRTSLLPVPVPRLGCSYLLSAIAVIHQRKVLLIRRTLESGVFWSIPETHVTSGENSAFAASRFLRTSFGLTLHPTKFIGVEHNGRSDHGLDGARFNLFHFVEEKDIPHDVGFVSTDVSPSPMVAWRTPHTAPLEPPASPDLVELVWADRALVTSMNEAGILRAELFESLRSLLTCSNPSQVGGTIFHVQA